MKGQHNALAGDLIAVLSKPAHATVDSGDAAAGMIGLVMHLATSSSDPRRALALLDQTWMLSMEAALKKLPPAP